MDLFATLRCVAWSWEWWPWGSRPLGLRRVGHGLDHVIPLAALSVCVLTHGRLGQATRCEELDKGALRMVLGNPIPYSIVGLAVTGSRTPPGTRPVCACRGERGARFLLKDGPRRQAARTLLAASSLCSRARAQAQASRRRQTQAVRQGRRAPSRAAPYRTRTAPRGAGYPSHCRAGVAPSIVQPPHA